MTGNEFRKLLDLSEIKVKDVSDSTGMAPQTIYNFINNESVTRRTKLTLEQFAQKLLLSNAGGRRAAG